MEILTHRQRVVYDLVEAFSEGNKISLEEVMSLLKTDLKERAYTIISEVRTKLWKTYEMPLCALGNGNYGVPENEEEVAEAARRYTNSMRNVSFLAMQLYDYSKQNKILPEGLRIKSLNLPEYASK